jgi:hypothetical protein
VRAEEKANEIAPTFECGSLPRERRSAFVEIVGTIRTASTDELAAVPTRETVAPAALPLHA